MWILGVAVIAVLLLYIFILQRQLSSINKQLTQRLHGKNSQPISIELLNKELNILVSNINRVLMDAQTSRSLIKREEKYYKEMISNISHDLRTPLTAIKGYQQMLLKEPLAEEQLAKLRIAVKHVIRLEQLLETFFEYSYLFSTDAEPNKDKLHLTNILIESVAGVFAQFEEKGIEIDILESEPVIIYSDEEMVLRILHNLVRNSIMHAQEHVTIHIWVEKEYAYISFENPIQDDLYINPNQLFDRFYTTDNSRQKNSGLGLSIVKLLAEKLGGGATAKIENGKIEFLVKVKNGFK